MPSGFESGMGTTVVRKRSQRDSNGNRRKGIKIRYIKTLDGWKRYANHLFVLMNGPLPKGKRVYHLDQDYLNDNPENLVAMTPGEWMQHCKRLDPKMAEENARGSKRLDAMREKNTIDARIRRTFEFLPRYFYEVRDADKQIINEPFRVRRVLADRLGVKVSRNGRLPKGCKIRLMRGEDIQADDVRRFYKKIGNEPANKKGLN